MMSLITPSLELDALADCDLIIEAVYANMDVKKEIFGKLDKIAKPAAYPRGQTDSLDTTRAAGRSSGRGGVRGSLFSTAPKVMSLMGVCAAQRKPKKPPPRARPRARKSGRVGGARAGAT